MPKSSKGFTLVELLVVVSIISILSVIGIIVYNNVQKNARDARRKSDIDAIVKAMETHFGECEAGKYCSLQNSWFNNGVPRDPINGGGCGPTGQCEYCFVEAGNSPFVGSSNPNDQVGHRGCNRPLETAGPGQGGNPPYGWVTAQEGAPNYGSGPANYFRICANLETSSGDINPAYSGPTYFYCKRSIQQ